MMKRKQILVLVIAGVVAMVLGAIAGRYTARYFEKQEAAERQAASAIARPETLPPFTLYDMNGEPVTTEQLLAHDKALFINFWATWCRPCREEMPLLTKMQEKYKDRLLMVGIAIDNKEAVAEFLEHIGGVNYPILLGEQELDAIETANAMGVDLIGLPISITTDKAGKIVEIHTGEVDEAEATALIEAVL
ncbi:MAG TPA: TlpA disulfide reductase family protein [Gammaproteobacteria bacterium]